MHVVPYDRESQSSISPGVFFDKPKKHGFVRYARRKSRNPVSRLEFFLTTRSPVSKPPCGIVAIQYLAWSFFDKNFIRLGDYNSLVSQSSISPGVFFDIFSGSDPSVLTERRNPVSRLEFFLT